MGWLGLVVLLTVAFAALWRFGGLPRSVLELTAAALCMAATGYALQGVPGQKGSPVQSRETRAKLDIKEIEAQRKMRVGVGDDAAWLDMGSALGRAGATEEAVGVMRNAISKNPNSSDLWVGLGTALVAHGDGLLSPAATFAFQRAAMLAPENPGPPFFFGLALAQQGKTEEAADVWRGLLAKTPKDAPWRADLEQRLTAIGGMPVAKAEKP